MTVLSGPMPYEYTWYHHGGTAGETDLVGILVFRGDVTDSSPTAARIMNLVQSQAENESFRGDLASPGDFLVSNAPIIHPDLPRAIRMRGLSTASTLPFLVFGKIGPTVNETLANQKIRDGDYYFADGDVEKYTSTFLNKNSPDSDRFKTAQSARQIAYQPIYSRIFVADSAAGAIWDLNNLDLPNPYANRNSDWSITLSDGFGTETANSGKRNIIISDDQRYIILLNERGSPGSPPLIYEQDPTGINNNYDVRLLFRNNPTRLNTLIGTPSVDGTGAYDPFNNELHYSTFDGQTARINLDDMSIKNSITTSNPGMISNIAGIDKIDSASDLSAMLFVDSDLCIATFKSLHTTTFLLRKLSDEWIIQSYPFIKNSRTNGSNNYEGIHTWPLNKNYVLITTTTGGISQNHWYKRNGYTFDYVGPLVVGGSPIYDSSSAGFRILGESVWVNTMYLDVTAGNILTPFSPTTQKIIDLEPLHHISAEDGEYTEHLVDIGTKRIRPNNTPHTYLRATNHKKTDIGNPSLGGYYRSHAFSNTSRVDQTSATFPDLAGQTSGTVTLLFKTSSDFSGYTNTLANYVNPLFKIAQGASGRRLLFGLNAASGVVKFAVGYYTTTTPGTTTTRKRVCDTTPLVADTWYVASVYQPGNGTDLTIKLNGVTQSYTTTGTASVDGWIGDVIPLTTDSRQVGLGGQAANEQALTQFLISDAAIFNRQLTSAEDSDLSTLVIAQDSADSRYPIIWKDITFGQSTFDALRYGYGSGTGNDDNTSFGSLSSTTYKTSTIKYFTNKQENDSTRYTSGFKYTFRLEIDGTVAQNDFLYLDYVRNITTGDRYKLFASEATYTAASGGSNNVWVWELYHPTTGRRLTTGTTILRFVF